ncbi:hypothetical protein D3C78_1445000 [compost metagenome]
MTGTALAKIRHEGLGHRHRAKHVDVELATHLLQRRFFENAFMAVAGIVDQDIDRAVSGFYLRHRAIDSIELGDIQDHAMGTLRGERFEGLQRRLTAHGADDTVARCKCFLRQGVAQATAHAGDEEVFSVVHGELQWINRRPW